MRSLVDRVVFGVAALRILAGLAGVGHAVWAGEVLSRNLPLWVFPAQMLVFAGSAAVLLRGARGDARVVSLAGVLLLIATSFARTPVEHLETSLGGSLVLAVLRGARVDALLPFYVWRFFTQFPRAVVSHRVGRAGELAVAASAAAGTALVLANLASALSPGLAPLLAPLSAHDDRSVYWPIVYGLTLPALPFALWKVGRASLPERRRAALLAAGVAAAALPIVAFAIAMGAAPAFADWFEEGGRQVVLPVIELLIFSLPLTMTYAVLVHRALPVRVAARQAARYALARGAVGAAAFLPFAWMIWLAYEERGRTLGDLATGAYAVTFLAVGSLGVLALAMRARAQTVIDRAFFREAFDSHQALRSVAESCQRVGRVGELAHLLATELDRAFHPQRVVVLVARHDEGALRAVRGAARPVARDSRLAALLAREREPLEIDLERPDARLAALPEDERHWLADGSFRLLVPLVSAAGELVGILGLGEKRSELPYTREDRQLLSALAAAGALTLESRLRAGSLPPAQEASEREEPALGCESCGKVVRGPAPSCARCGGRLVDQGVPLVLLGKFRVEERIGEGAMGVVFRATDLGLGRAVAVKTLPRTSPEEIATLRREARAMATVMHPHLAVLYSVESFRGTPILVTELLSGGTLAQRCKGSGLPPREVRELGADMAAALGVLHRSGVLHRDVKPSNIAFTEDGIPKLLDFGLATAAGEVGDGSLVGTLLYLAPEALNGERPDPGFDLWALAVVLYEALSGRHPMERESWVATNLAIRAGELPPRASLPPETPAEVAAFFEGALHRERGRRPRSAEEFAARWQDAWSGT